VLGCEIAIVRLHDAEWIYKLFTLVTFPNLHISKPRSIVLKRQRSSFISDSALGHESRRLSLILTYVVFLNNIILFFEFGGHAADCELQNVVQPFLLSQL
jgi:hypothetical protein